MCDRDYGIHSDLCVTEIMGQDYGVTVTYVTGIMEVHSDLCDRIMEVHSDLCVTGIMEVHSDLCDRIMGYIVTYVTGIMGYIVIEDHTSSSYPVRLSSA